MSKKLSVAASALLLLAICCSFALKKPQAAQELEVLKSTYTKAPITILSATPTASGVTVQVRNDADAPVEYFELRFEGSRAWAGRTTIDTQHMKHPKWLEQMPLSLAPSETRTFDFPVRTNGKTVSIYMVLLSNGKGYLKGWWLRKVDAARPGGLLWTTDHEETEKHRVKQIVKREVPRNVGKSASLKQQCPFNTGLESVNCTSNLECRLIRGVYVSWPYGVNVVWLDTDCYIPFDPVSCGLTEDDYPSTAC